MDILSAARRAIEEKRNITLGGYREFFELDVSQEPIIFIRKNKKSEEFLYWNPTIEDLLSSDWILIDQYPGIQSLIGRIYAK